MYYVRKSELCLKAMAVMNLEIGCDGIYINTGTFG